MALTFLDDSAVGYRNMQQLLKSEYQQNVFDSGINIYKKRLNDIIINDQYISRSVTSHINFRIFTLGINR